MIEVRLGANDSEFVWESELGMTDQISLTAKADATWVERWRLVASPVWNIDISGLAPTFDPSNPELVPIWYPWPGEAAQLSISRPEAIPGATVTINSVQHEIALGKRQRVSRLDLSIRSSLGEDFLVDLPADAEITSLTQSGRTIPVRKDGTKLIVPLQPGEQSVSVGWKINQRAWAFFGCRAGSTTCSECEYRDLYAHPGRSMDPLDAWSSPRSRREILEHPGLRIDRSMGAGSYLDLSAAVVRMDASGHRTHPGALAGCFGRNRMVVFPRLARAAFIPRPSRMGLQFAPTLSDCSDCGDSRHLCGRRGSGSSGQSGNVYLGQWFPPDAASLVSSAVRCGASHAWMLCSFHLVVSDPHARLGTLVGSIAHSMAPLGLGPIQRWRILPKDGKEGAHAAAFAYSGVELSRRTS